MAVASEAANMRLNASKIVNSVGIVALALGTALPGLATAQGHDHAGGGHSAGGHAFAPHFSAPHASTPHFAAPHYSAPHYSAPHYTAPHYAAAPHYPSAHFAAATPVYHAGWHGPGVRPGYPGIHYGYGPHPYWGGGYWHGSYWPRAYYGWAYPWFLPVLPALYATYWWGGVPYYYANNVYYTYSQDDNGYVVTDPPPSDSGSPASVGNDATPPNAGATGVGDVYMYPRNGQSDQQQSTDRYECHKWAQAQTGFDPTQQSSASSGNAGDYRRALVACLDARGYSAR